MKKEIFSLILIGAIIFFLNYILVWAETRVEGGAITSFSEAFWYMVVTLTTVGYGDLYPVTTIGKIIGYLYVFSSIGLLGLFLSTVMNRYNEINEEKKLGFKGTRFENHVVLFGWNDFSRMVIDGVINSGVSVDVAIVTDHKDDVDLIYDEFGSEHIFVLFADLHNTELYQKINGEQSRVIFISLENDADAMMHVVSFRKHCPNAEIIVSTSKSNLKETFEAAGVTHVVARNEIVSKLVASYIFEPDVAELNLDLLESSTDESDYDVMEFRATEANQYLGKDAHTIFHELKKDFDAVLMAIGKVEGIHRRLLKNPSKDTLLEVDDYLIVMANKPIKVKLENAFDVKEGL